MTGPTGGSREALAASAPLLAAYLAAASPPEPVVDPRTAFFGPWKAVPAGEAPGRASAELIAAYPPGVPILAPGELITPEVLGALRRQAAEGSRIAYAADPTLRTLRVLTDVSPVCGR